MLADSMTEILAGKALVLGAAWLRDEGKAVILEAACTKLFCSDMVGRVADRYVQIHGVAEYAIERFNRDVRLFQIFEGSSQIQQLVIARRLLKGLG